MISQSNSHLHMTAQWLVPPIVWCVIRLTRVPRDPAPIVRHRRSAWARSSAPSPARRGGALPHRAHAGPVRSRVRGIRWRWARRSRPASSPAGDRGRRRPCCVLAYPLWVQLPGRSTRRTRRSRPEFFYADVATYWLFSPLSIARARRPASWPPARPSTTRTSACRCCSLLRRCVDLAVALPGGGRRRRRVDRDGGCCPSDPMSTSTARRPAMPACTATWPRSGRSTAPCRPGTRSR